LERMTTSVPQNDLARLDRLISQVATLPESQSDLLLEHLRSARTYLLGAMPEEYGFSLRSARETATIGLADASVQRSVTKDLAGLLDGAHARTGSERGLPAPHRRNPSAIDHTKSELRQFFHGTETTLGVFYPKHYIFAAFPSLQRAKTAALALKSAGYSDVLAASAEETSRFFDELRSAAGIWGALMASVSRFFGTEEVFADIDAREAQKGAGFLAVYSPKEAQAEQILDLVAPFDPLVMQLYLPGGIRSLCAGKFPGPQGYHLEQ
jgi:hypothetical protein